MIRLAVVACVAGLGLAVALLAPRMASRRRERAELDLTGIDGRVVLFSDPSCHSCDRVRSMLAAEGGDFIEVAFERGSERWRRIGIEAVPLLVVRGSEGIVEMQISGVPSVRRLRRALRRAGSAPGEATSARALEEHPPRGRGAHRESAGPTSLA